MLKSLFFIFAFIFLWANITVVYKLPHKISLIKSVIVSLITELCIGALIAQCYSLVNIWINLSSMGIGFLGVGAALLFYNIRNKKIQSFSLAKEEMVSVSVICVWFAIVFLKVFSADIGMNYINVDPANHFYFALNFMNTGKLSSMYFAELYNGLFIQMFQPLLNELTYYKAFIVSDSLANLLNVLMFYCMADSFAKTKFTKYGLGFIGFLYFMGWPFYNYAIGGFVYFGWGVTLSAYVVFLLILLNQTKEKKQQVVLWLLSLAACFCVLRCYMYFAPVAGVCVLCAFFIFIKNSKIQISTRMKVIIGIVVLGIAAAAVGVVFLGFFRGSLDSFLDALRMDGGIHRELYKDFIFVIPPAVYMFMIRKNQKKLNAVYLMTGIILGYIAVTLICCCLGIMSPYYYYKSYYMLWFFVWIICVDAVDYFMQKDRLAVWAYGGTLCLVIGISLSGVENSQGLRDKRIVPNELTGHDNHVSFSIYGQPEIYLEKKKDEADWDAFLELCEFVNQEYAKEDSKICFVSSSYYMGAWFRNFTGGRAQRAEFRENIEDILNKLESQEIEYIVMHQNSDLFRANLDMFLGLEEIYDNGYYCLYK